MPSSYNVVQTFYLDSGAVGGAPSVRISAVDLYFSAKPDRSNNAAGITNPGVSLIVVPTTYGVPYTENVVYPTARTEYDSIATTSDASLPTQFRFSDPILCDTDTQYAIMIMFDGSLPFQLWTCVTGDYNIVDKSICPGPSNKFIGSLYDYNNQVAANSTAVISATTANALYQSSWTPISDTDLKFTVYCARYAYQGFPYASNTSLPANVALIPSKVMSPPGVTNAEEFLFPSKPLELIMFNQASSRKEQFVGGQWAYQNTVPFPGGFTANNANNSTFLPVSVTGSNRVVAPSQYANGKNFSWRDIYPSVGLTGTSTDSDYIVLKDTLLVNVRQVLSIASNTILIIDENTSFVNSACQFLVTPVGIVDSFNKSSPFGEFKSIMALANSSANSTCRFTTNSIQPMWTVIDSGGTSYSNTDILYITGFENVSPAVTGNYPAVANLQTNSTGGVTGLYFSNIGAGFNFPNNIKAVVANTANVNPTSNTSAGSGLTLSINVSTQVYTELRNNCFDQCQISNFALSDVIPYFDIYNPVGTQFDLLLTLPYYTVANTLTSIGQAYYVNPEPPTIPLTMFVKNPFSNTDLVPCFVSRSNEWVTKYANGGQNDQVGPGLTSNSVVMTVNSTSNSDYMSILINSTPTFSLGTYIVNDSYANEHTDQGNAWARQITTLTTLQAPAEDLQVYLSAYMPVGTDLQVYARILNEADPEAFDDKDWTHLQLNSLSVGLQSSPTNPSDFIELSYGFKPFPTSNQTLTGTLTGNASNTVITGVGTSFNTQISAGDLLQIADPLFPGTYMIDVVNTVTNATSLTLNNPISNNLFEASGLIGYQITGDDKSQAFNNWLNSNVVRYYTQSGVPYDGYSSVQVKIVMLAEVPNFVPRIDDIRFLALSS